MNSIGKFELLGTVCVLTFWSGGAAWAYLDPATGSLIIQSIIGGIAAASAMVGVYWQRVKSLFSRQSADPGDTGDTPE